jgi:hypothetical protein
MENAHPTEAEASAPGKGAAIASLDRFHGTSNPRYLRILAGLLVRSRTREEIDRIAGASNGPAAIAEIRALGLPKPDYLPCERTPTFDRDGKEVKRGIYCLTEKGRRRVIAWMNRREKGLP